MQVLQVEVDKTRGIVLLPGGEEQIWRTGQLHSSCCRLMPSEEVTLLHMLSASACLAFFTDSKQNEVIQGFSKLKPPQEQQKLPGVPQELEDGLFWERKALMELKQSAGEDLRYCTGNAGLGGHPTQSSLLKRHTRS